MILSVAGVYVAQPNNLIKSEFATLIAFGDP
jgi:hypothetical protein